MKRLLLAFFFVLAIGAVTWSSRPANAALGDTFLASLANGSTTTQGGNDSFNASMTPDGRYVVFASLATNLATFTDGNTAGGTDVFWRDTQTNATELISVSVTAGTSGNGASNNPTISDDGCRVAFQSNASNLIAPNTVDTNGQMDTYIRDRCTGPATRLVSKDATPKACTGFDPMISGNGQYVAYYANESFGGCHIDLAFTATSGDIFVYDWNLDASKKVSLKNGSTTLQSTNGFQPQNPSISADGCRIAFSSGQDLVVPTPNPAQFMVRDRCAGAGNATFIVSRGEGVSGTIPTDVTPQNGMISADGNFFTFVSNTVQLSTPPGATQTQLLQILADPGAGVAPKFTSGCVYSGANCSAGTVTCTVGYQCGYNWNPAGTTGAMDIHCSGDNITNTQAHCENTLLPGIGLTFTNFSGTGGAQFLGTPQASAVAGSPYTLNMTLTNGVNPPAVQIFTLVINAAPGATPVSFVTPSSTVTGQVNTLSGLFINAIGSDALAFRCGASPTNVDPALDQTCGGQFGAGWQGGYTDNGQGTSNFRGSTWGTNAAAACPLGTPCTLNFKVIAKPVNIWVRDIGGSHTTQANVTTGGTPSNQNAFNPSISADGRYIIFASASPDLGGASGRQDVFIRDRIAPVTELASVGTGNIAPNTVGFPNSSIFDSTVTISNNWTSRTGVSTDGRYVLFTSKASNLAPVGLVSDANGKEDVFIHQRLASAPTTATFTVNKDFIPNSGASVTIHLVCGGGATVAGDLPATEAAPAIFTVNSVPGGGTTCTATETPVPGGYTANQTNCVNVATTQGGTPSCTITNTSLTTATFTVSKDFIPDNVASVTIHVVCTGGAVVAGDLPATEAAPAIFNLTSVPVGGTTCTATEPTTPVGFAKNESACAAVVIAAGGSGACTITNTANTTFTVNKDFVPDSAASVNIHVTCTAGATVAGDLGVTEAVPAVFNILNVPVGGTSCTATETPVPSGYSVSQSGCIGHAILPGQTNQSCTFTNTSISGASFTVNKDFVPNSGASVNIHVVCTAGATVAGDLPATEAAPAVFSVGNIPGGGTSCTATEVPAPAGYTSNVTGCANVAVAIASSPSCTIVNTALPNTGTFTVNKDFIPNAATSVTITLTCTGGASVAGTLPATEAAPAVFSVSSIPVGGTQCTATEAVPAGYTANQAACVNVALAQAGTANCTITNTLNPTTGTFTVNKVFSPSSAATVSVSLTCTAGTVTTSPLNASQATPATFSVTGIGGSNTCTATETVPAGYTAAQATCAAVALVGGGTASCTITNTAIPAVTPPTVTTTSPATAITTTGATLSGNVTSIGGGALSARGIVLAQMSVNPNPQIGGTGVTVLTDATSVLGAFSENASGLLAGTNYSFVAYATNAGGTSYGAVVIFTTATQPPPPAAGPKQPAPTPTQSAPVATKKFNGVLDATVPAVGTNVTLTFTVTNPNATALTGVGFVDTMPNGSGLTVVAGSTVGNCDAGIVLLTSTTVTLAGATLPANSSCSFSVTVTAATLGSWNNYITANANGTGFGPQGAATLNVGVIKPPKSP